MKKFLLSLVASAFAMGMSAQTNLLTNGGFEEWSNGLPVNWKSACTASNASVKQSSDSDEGNYSVEVSWNKSGNKRLAYKELNLKAGTYSFSYSAKSASEEGLAKIAPGYVPVTNGSVGTYVYRSILDEEGKSNVVYTDVPADDWMSEGYRFTLEENTTICLVIMVHKTGLGNVLIDDASLTTTDGGIDDGFVEEKYDATGAGTLDSPYTIDDVRGLLGKSYAPTTPVWVKGTIVGTVKDNKTLNEENIPSNIALGTAENWIPVELPSNGDVRKVVNLVDNASNLNKEVWVYGNIASYFSTAGIKGTSDCSWDGVGSGLAGIEAISADTKSTVIYDLSGRRVNRAVNGVFIVNGKKVIR